MVRKGKFRSSAVLLACAATFTGMYVNPSVAADPVCAATTNSAGSYSVDICITSPSDGQVVSGDAQVAATTQVNSAGGAAPAVSKTRYRLAALSATRTCSQPTEWQTVLTDFEEPWAFLVPTYKFTTGRKSLLVEATLDDGFVATSCISLQFEAGPSPSPVAQFVPGRGSQPGAGEPLVVAAVGDGAGGKAASQRVADLIGTWNPNTFLSLGDVYNSGTDTEFYNWYGHAGEFFSRFNAITNPTIGNHEYGAREAHGYFDYWGMPRESDSPIRYSNNYYSFDAGGWHFISFNSNRKDCPPGSLQERCLTPQDQRSGGFYETLPGTAQYEWLAAELAANADKCTVVFSHHPRFSVGHGGDSDGRFVAGDEPTPDLTYIWGLLAQNDVELVLTGHDHNYQRWAPMDENGEPKTDGVTQFIVGTGGHEDQGFVREDGRVGYKIRTEGALRLELANRTAAYRYVDVQGATLDSGITNCDPQASPTPSPTPTASPTPSPTPTASPTPSPTPTASPTPSPTPTARPTPTVGPTPTGTPGSFCKDKKAGQK